MKQKAASADFEPASWRTDAWSFQAIISSNRFKRLTSVTVAARLHVLVSQKHVHSHESLPWVITRSDIAGVQRRTSSGVVLTSIASCWIMHAEGSWMEKTKVNRLKAAPPGSKPGASAGHMGQANGCHSRGQPVIIQSRDVGGQTDSFHQSSSHKRRHTSGRFKAT